MVEKGDSIRRNEGGKRVFEGMKFRESRNYSRNNSRDLEDFSFSFFFFNS